MLRSGLASLIVDVNLRRTLRPSPTFSFPAHLSRCIITSRYSSRTSLRFPIQISRHQHRLSYFSSSSSSEQSRPTSSSRNSFSGHGQLDSDDNSSPPPSQSSSKVLTLPTVLTLGRVAAVPLLVASTLLCYLQLFWIRMCHSIWTNKLSWSILGFLSSTFWFCLKTTLNTDTLNLWLMWILSFSVRFIERLVSTTLSSNLVFLDCILCKIVHSFVFAHSLLRW